MLVLSENMDRYPICQELMADGVLFELYEHPPVFTVEEGLHIMGSMPGHGTKNLFLRDKKGEKFYLITVSEEKRVDLKRLADQLHAGRFSFGSADKMQQYLGIEPGSVTILALLNNNAAEIQAFMDDELFNYPLIQCHPLRNDASIAVCPVALHEYLMSRNRAVRRITIPVISN